MTTLEQHNHHDVVQASTTTASRAAIGLKTIDRTALQSLADTTVKESLIPGLVIKVQSPQGEFVAAAGSTKRGEEQLPDTGTHFRIGSVTKTMTAAAILQLAQEGKLRVGDAVSKYIPGVPNGDDITVAQLMELRSGLYNYTTADEISGNIDNNPAKVWTSRQLLDLAFSQPPGFAPGAEYEYNNTNYLLLGLIIEKLDGKPLATVFHDRLFEPLGMSNTTLPASGSNTLPEPYSHGYLYGSSSVVFQDTTYTPEMENEAKAGRLQPTDFTDVDHSFAGAAGAVVSTADDLATWIKALAGGKVLDDKYQRLWADSPQLIDPSNPYNWYGYGIDQMRWGPNTIFIHGGQTAGYNTEAGYDPVNDVTVVIWTNLTLSLDNRYTAEQLMLKVLDQVYATSPLAPPPATAVASSSIADQVNIGGGGMVVVDGRDLFLECRGTGSPTVVLQSGFGNAGDIWSLSDTTSPAVFPALAETNRVCIYDRPGSMITTTDTGGNVTHAGTDRPGRSGSAPMPRHPADVVTELHDLLAAADVPGPYVLVGHSLGGAFDLLYARTYPDEVAGLVLVDSPLPTQRALIRPELWEAVKVMTLGASEVPGYELESYNLDTLFDEIEAAGPLPAIPVVVIRRAKANMSDDDTVPEGAPFTRADVAALTTAQWEAQVHWASSVPGAEVITVPETTHYVQSQRPDVVVDAIRGAIARR